MAGRTQDSAAFRDDVGGFGSTLRPAVSEGHRRAHVQSLAKMSREALAERLFSEKETIVTLHEQLVCNLILMCLQSVLWCRAAG